MPSGMEGCPKHWRIGRILGEGAVLGTYGPGGIEGSTGATISPGKAELHESYILRVQ